MAKDGHEEDILLPLTVPEENRSEFWDIWGLLDDGTILNPLQTEVMLSTFAGNQYNKTVHATIDRTLLEDASKT